MFTKIASLVQPIVRQVKIMRDYRNEIAADEIIGKDPYADDIFTVIDGVPVSYRGFNRLLRKEIRDNSNS